MSLTRGRWVAGAAADALAGAAEAGADGGEVGAAELDPLPPVHAAKIRETPTKPALSRDVRIESPPRSASNLSAPIYRLGRFGYNVNGQVPTSAEAYCAILGRLGGGSRAMTHWIGRVDPSMWWQGAWWQEMLPPGVRLAILSLGVQRLVDDELEQAHATILEKVEILDREGVDVINVGGSPVVGVHGKAGHDRLLADLARITTRPFVTALQAELEGLRLLRAERVAIAAPYPHKQTERRVAVLAEEGVNVIGHRSLDIERNRQITELEFGDVRSFAIQVAEEYPKADVLYLPCGALPVTRVIAEIERATGKAVVTNVQAQLAACLRRMGHGEPVQGYGRLLERVGAAAA